MNWELVATIAASAVIIAAWIWLVYIVAKNDADERAKQRALRDVQLAALRQVGIDKTRSLDIRV